DPYDSVTYLPVGGICSGTFCDHCPLRSPVVLRAPIVCIRFLTASGTVDDGPLSSRRVDHGCRPPLEPAYTERGRKGCSLARPACLGLGLWRVASAYLSFPSLRHRLLDADKHLLFGVPLLCVHAGRPGAECRSYRLEHLRLHLVSLHISGRSAAAAALLSGVS